MIATTARVVSPLFAVLFLLMLPGVAHASGGGPLLPLICVPSFLVAFLLSLPFELLLMKRLVKGVARRAVLFDIVVATGLSFVAVCVAIPLTIAGVGFVGAFLGGSLGARLLLFGTWVWDGNPNNQAAVWISVGWIVVLLVGKVVLEGLVLKRRWLRRDRFVVVSPFVAAAWLNAINGGMAVMSAVIIWRDLW